MRITGWREVPSQGRRYLGLRLWFSGAEISIGRNMWRLHLEGGPEICFLLRKHDPITVIERAAFDRMNQNSEGLYVEGRIVSQHVECYRCKKKLD